VAALFITAKLPWMAYAQHISDLPRHDRMDTIYGIQRKVAKQKGNKITTSFFSISEGSGDVHRAQDGGEQVLARSCLVGNFICDTNKALIKIKKATKGND